MSTANQFPFHRQRWTEQDARRALDALKRSGKSVRDFAEEHGLDPQRLWSWRRRVAGGDATTFRELIVRRSSVSAVTEGAPFEIQLPSGFVIRVPVGFDADALARLLTVLAQARAC